MTNFKYFLIRQQVTELDHLGHPNMASLESLLASMISHFSSGVGEWYLASITETSRIELHCSLDIVEKDFIQVTEEIQVPLVVLCVEVVRHFIAILIKLRGLLKLNLSKDVKLCKQLLDIIRSLQTTLSQLFILLLLLSQLLLSLPLFRLYTSISSLEGLLLDRLFFKNSTFSLSQWCRSLLEHHHLLRPHNLLLCPLLGSWRYIRSKKIILVTFHAKTTVWKNLFLL